MSINFSIVGIDIPFWIIMAITMVTSFVITFISIPTIVTVSKFKKLLNIPNERASHNGDVPVLASLAIFSGFTLTAIICTYPVKSEGLVYILAGIIVLLFLGLKDDLLMLDPKKKVIGQIIAASFVVILGDIRITNFHNVLGIGDIQYIPSIIFTIFFFLTLINGFNLIDGVDGLAAGNGILSSLLFGVWFIYIRNFSYAILCFSLTGSLLAYFRFNVWGEKNKIFMGDSGAMIIGLIMAVFATQFLEMEKATPGISHFKSAPAVAFGLLFIPLFDTLRIIAVRILSGNSPFQADRRHIHHLILQLGLNHLQVSIVLISFNIIILIAMYLMQPLGSLPDIMIALLISSLISWYLSHTVSKKGVTKV